MGHQMIPHHHHDTVVFDFTHSHVEVEKHHHKHNGEHHHHDTHERSDDKKDVQTKHKHPFSNHQHVSATEDFDCTRTNTQQTKSNIQSKNLFVSLSLLHKQKIKPPKLNKCSFEEPPFLISLLSEPAAIALRGPPSIA